MTKWEREEGKIRRERRKEEEIEIRIGENRIVKEEGRILRLIKRIEEGIGIFGRRIESTKNESGFNLKKGALMGVEWKETRVKNKGRDKERLWKKYVIIGGLNKVKEEGWGKGENVVKGGGEIKITRKEKIGEGEYRLKGGDYGRSKKGLKERA